MSQSSFQDRLARIEQNKRESDGVAAGVAESGAVDQGSAPDRSYRSAHVVGFLFGVLAAWSMVLTIITLSLLEQGYEARVDWILWAPVATVVTCTIVMIISGFGGIILRNRWLMRMTGFILLGLITSMALFLLNVIDPWNTLGMSTFFAEGAA